MTPGHWWAALVACVLTGLLTGLIRVYAVRTNLMDVPNARSSHARATPRGGGLAIVLVTQVAVLALWLLGELGSAGAVALLAGGSAVALVGWLDDRIGLSARLRLGVHLAACTVAVWAIVGPDAGWLASTVLVVGMAWFLNLFNFMDGIDGIAGAEAVCSALIAALLINHFGGGAGLVALALILGGASLGFLVWNWAPARIFLGDAGSGYLGYTLGVMALLSARSTAVPLTTWLILAGVFIVDATVTLIRRGLRGEKVYEAHRSHAYQHLARRWGRHDRVSAAVVLINVLWLGPLAFWSVEIPEQGFLLLGLAWAPLTILAGFLRAGQPD